ncbi:hypothetical protein OIU78_022164 [Salix suchowensis]|nr:hypothetical protein OIU78_022164 [Salix suchowensis]
MRNWGKSSLKERSSLRCSQAPCPWPFAIYRGFFVQDHSILNLEFCVCRDLRMDLNSMRLIFFSFVRYPFPQAFTLVVSGLSRYVAVMNAIFSAQRSMVPIDSCYVGAHNSAFLQQASYITGGVYVKPQHLDGLFQYLTTVFATDLHSRSFIQLPRPAGVDFRASCFCHKTTIDMGYICSVCLSIFCNHHKKCSTCGSVFGQAQSDTSSASDLKRKAPET